MSRAYPLFLLLFLLLFTPTELAACTDVPGLYAEEARTLDTKVRALREAGIPDKVLLAKLDLLPEELSALARGEDAGLSPEVRRKALREAGKLEQAFLHDAVPAADLSMVPGGNLAKLFERFARIDDGSLAKARLFTRELYDTASEEIPDPSLRARYGTLRMAASRLLEGYREHTSETGTAIGGEITAGGKRYFFENTFASEQGQRFVGTGFGRDIGDPREKPLVKVYVNVPFAKIPRAMRELTPLAEGDGALGIKFQIVSEPAAADKVVAHFDSPEAAFRFAEKARKWAAESNVTGSPPTLTFRVGKGPVSLGVDPARQPGEPRSWRGHASEELALALRAFSGAGARRDALLLRYLRYRGVDPEYWLPTDFVQQHRPALDALR